MKVSVRFYGHLRDLVDKKERIEFELEEGNSVLHLLDELILDQKVREHMFDENTQLNSDITILINGREIKFLSGIETVLKSGDEIQIFPMVAGG